MLEYLTHFLADGVRMGAQMDEARGRNSNHLPLFIGQPTGALAALSPALFNFKSPAPFAHWYFKKGWGQSWGILLRSSLPMHELQGHFRRFLRVQTDTGKSLFFRYYDPRVLRIFLPTCSSVQLRDFFGAGIDYFITEDEDPAFALRFSVQNGKLQQERFAVSEIIGAMPDAGQTQPSLPPETIEALQNAGMLEQVLALMNGPAGDGADEPSKAAAKSVDNTLSGPAEPQPTPKPKTKWNMFD